MTHEKINRYTHETIAGEFALVRRGQSWQIEFEGDCLGTHYLTAGEALENLKGGHCDWPSVGDPAEMDIPEDLSDWSATASRTA